MATNENKHQMRLMDLNVDCLDRIFMFLNYDGLGSLSRTCNFFNDRIEEFKGKYVDVCLKKLKYYNRHNITKNPDEIEFEFDEEDDDTACDGNFLVDFDDEEGPYSEESEDTEEVLQRLEEDFEEEFDDAMWENDEGDALSTDSDISLGGGCLHDEEEHWD